MGAKCILSEGLWHAAAALIERAGMQEDCIVITGEITPQKLQTAIDGAGVEPGCLLLAFGADNLPPEGLTGAGHTLVLPRVHDLPELLLGSAERYRAAMEECGDLPYFYHSAFAGCGQLGALNCLNKGHEWLCNIVSPKLTLAELGQGRGMAQSLHIDYREYTQNLCLLSGLLYGCRDDRFVTVPAGHRVRPSYDPCAMRVE